MAKEIERKFLVVNDSYRSECSRVIEIVQSYLSIAPEATVRVRIYGDKAFLTIKTKNRGIARDEWEYEIPVEDAREMISRCECHGSIAKTRYISGRWEIDEFHGALEGLVVAEIELNEVDETVDLPSYIGKEVSGDPRYYNSMLSNATAPPEETA